MHPTPSPALHLLVLGQRPQQLARRRAGDARWRDRVLQLAGDDPGQVGTVDGPLAPATPLGMSGDFGTGMQDQNLAGLDPGGDGASDQAPGHAVMVGVEIDAAVAMDTPHHLAELSEGRASRERPQRRRLISVETLDRCLADRAVDAPVGDLPRVQWARCASNAAQDAKSRPAMALAFT